eukprot:TRINITY_DN20568_c0_g1_i1.p1 TRINITY_DN20568_c0_g1~~TRINITY_DN20568_c0_g1_i1.p1  ORF type:complete len:856 (-),score=192.77 TRINITY_DN20568_c0_g1_i1:34-2337(-)
MDLLHDQVHREIYDALKHELSAVAHSISTVRAQAAEELRSALARDVAPLRQDIATLRGELVDELAAGLKRMRDEAAVARTEASDKARESFEALRSETHASVEKLQEALGALSADVSRSAAALKEDVDACREQLDSLGNHGTGVQPDCSEQLSKFEELHENGAAALASLSAKVEDAQANLCDTIDQKVQEVLAIAQSTTDARCNELASVAEAAVAELENRIFAGTQDSELRAAVEELKSTFDGKIRAVTGVAADRYKTFDEQVGQLKSSMQEAEKIIHDLRKDCRDRLLVADASWARSIDWAASVDMDKLEQESRFELESPSFTAGGLRGLRLCLTLEAAGPSSRAIPLDATQQRGSAEGASGQEARPSRWICGVHLVASDAAGAAASAVSEMSFRLHVGGRTQSFTASFGDAARCGSARLASVERADLAASAGTVPVRLEIVDVAASVAVAEASDGSLRAATHIADPEVAVNREVNALKASMVRRVEWKVARIKERVRLAARALEDRAPDEDALEPICSPPFSAAGLEGLQLHLYPMGYRPRGDGQCGLFLVCPRGVFLRCRAFVGDASRVFEHQFEAREPYGRGSFCRLEDKADSDDTVTCGIEILEVRQELVAQVRGGPFGNVADQLKVTLNPNATSMDLVRELRELGQESRQHPRHGGGGKSRATHAGGFHSSASMGAAARSRADWAAAVAAAPPLPARLPGAGVAPAGSQSALLPCALAASKSLPALVPGGPLASWPPVAAATAVGASGGSLGRAGGKLLPRI